MKRIAYIIPIIFISLKAIRLGYAWGVYILVGGIVLVNLWPYLDRKLKDYEDRWGEQLQEGESEWKNRRNKYLQNIWRGIYSKFKRK